MGQPIRILIADHDLEFSRQLKRFLDAQADTTVIEMVRDGQGTIEACKEMLPDVVVLDHHLGGETLPPALAVVNPNRQDEADDAPGHLCAAAVVFLLLVEVGRQLRDAGREGPDLIPMLDLVALATIADVEAVARPDGAYDPKG